MVMNTKQLAATLFLIDIVLGIIIYLHIPLWYTATIIWAACIATSFGIILAHGLNSEGEE